MTIFVLDTVSHCFYAWRRGFNVLGDLVWLIFWSISLIICIFPKPCTHVHFISFKLKCSLSESPASSLGSVLSKLFHFLLHSLLLFFCSLCTFFFLLFYCEYHEIDFISVNAMDWFSVRLTRTLASGLVQSLFYLKGSPPPPPLLCKGKLDWNNPVCHTNYSKQT